MAWVVLVVGEDDAAAARAGAEAELAIMSARTKVYPMLMQCFFVILASLKV
jgi:hypothetical protein